MENRHGTESHEDLDLLLWREFQDGLTSLLDISIALYDRHANLIAAPSRETPVCQAAAGSEMGALHCREQCVKAVSLVLETRQPHIFKCRTNQHIFAVPVFLDNGGAFVILGGQVYLEGSETKDFNDGVCWLGLDSAAVNNIKKGINVVSPKAMFTVPGIVNNLAAPFLRCLYSRGGEGAARRRGWAEGGWFKGFYELEQVYKSIAPLLDTDELYDTVLAKCLELVSAEKGSLMILDSDNKVLSVKAAKGIDMNVLDDIRIGVGEGISGRTVSEGAPVMVRDIEEEMPSRKNMPWYKTKSFISIPLKLDNRVIGVINISDKISGEVFSREDLIMLQSVAHYASIAFERGTYYSLSEELKVISMTDPLTGLFNRRYLHERTFEEVERVKRHGECFTLFMLDLDNFKDFNDRYGHVAGDEMLRAVARKIRDAVRSMDVVARYGGEEFAVILPHTGKKESTVIAERIRQSVEDMKKSPGVFRLTPTISIGISEFPDDASTIELLIDNADRSMYMAKRTGKNKIVVFERRKD